DRYVPVPRTDRPVAAEDRPAVRRSRPHHGDARRAQDPLAHGRAAGGLQSGHRTHQPPQTAGSIGMTPPKTVGIAEHISVALVTFGAHRLWISLWTPLGWPADNAAAAGGNGGSHGPQAGRVHSPSPARSRPRTGPVTHRTAVGWDIARCPQVP